MTERGGRQRRWSALFAISAGMVMVLSALAVVGGGSVGASREAAKVTTAQVPGATPPAPASTALAALFTVYNSRPDLQAAFPNAATNSTSFVGLLDWAGGVVIHEFNDSDYATLAPFGYLYALMVVYNQRTDLQSAFPGIITGLMTGSNGTVYAQLVDWAGWVVTGAWTDSAAPPLDLYGYYYVLMMVYDGRSDLQAAFPDALGNQTTYELLVNWAGAVVTGEWTDGANATINPMGGYYYALMNLYDGRSDLQAAFPSAFTNEGSYEDLLEWADEVVTGVFIDANNSTLLPFSPTYEALAPSARPAPMETAFLVGNAATSKCPGSDTFAANGCTAGDYIYTLSVEASIVAFENALFEVETSEGAAYHHNGSGGFTVVNLLGELLVQTPIPNGSWMEMNSTFTFYSMGVWPETPMTSFDVIILDMGTVDPAAMGLTLVAWGTDGFTGSSEPLSLP